MPVASVSRKTLAVAVLATIAALVVRSWLLVALRDRGIPSTTATDLSYLVVPVILLLLLCPLWPTDKNYVASLFQRQHLSSRIVLRAILVGILLRVVAWCELIASVSFGRYVNTDANAIVGPSFGFDCPATELLLLGVLVMVLLVPIIEEIIHRGVVMGALDQCAPVLAVLTSALVFMAFHRPDSWAFAAFAGIVFGTLFWATGSLWSSVVAHATVNGLIQFDWRCLSGHWNPAIDSLPRLAPGLAALVIGLHAIAGIVWLLAKPVIEKKTAEAA
ncbi:MAG: CPBP family intramembrane metalloprotease [Gammaproteobacteria bacterium]|nr:CPBP family intramembrane metalloprotease [Gammaproteobacteria bacterium]